ncbi:MAG: NADH:ubiquinone reductase (Na(+)-transporting) subunit C [Cryomorphaceae bacterium]|nr:NADH:ubiquinone reductase (Na(+)-transporting) subunit C [Cryomorphaceae bacterium]
MDTNSNSYTFIFSTIMVIVVAASLAFVATQLQPKQAENVKQENWQNILKSIDVQVSRAEAEEAYNKHIVEELVIRGGEVVDDVKAFDVVIADEVKKPVNERNNPLYIGEKDGNTFYIIPLRGGGLWGPIWGYIALEKDVATVYGANFDHKSETPGLGAEINQASFYGQFKDKQILKENGDFTSVSVVKGSASGPHQVDGISGGTITSEGVSDMLKNCLAGYVDYLKARSSKHQESLPVEEIEADELLEDEEEDTENTSSADKEDELEMVEA